MKKSKKIILTIVQFILVAAFCIGLFVVQKMQMNPEKVYTITQEIPLGTKVVESDLKAITIPHSAVQKGMIKNAKSAVGKYAATNLYVSSYAMNSMFIEKDEVDPFEGEDLDKLRKISIPIEYADALGGNVKYGDRVDLAYVGQKDGGQESGEYTYSKTFIQNVLVFSVTTEDGYKYNDRTQRVEGEVTEGDATETNESTGTMKTITLAVTPAQAEEITARKKSGVIQIIGRFTESDEEQTPGYVIGDYKSFFTGEGQAETQQ